MRMIDANALKRKAQKVATESWKMKVRARVETILNEFIGWIDKAPTIEVVPVGVYKQVEWERDIAVGQLEKLGYKLGEKVTPIVRCKDCIYGVQDKDGWWFCSDLGNTMGDPETGDGFCSDGIQKDSGGNDTV